MKVIQKQSNVKGYGSVIMHFLSLVSATLCSFHELVTCEEIFIKLFKKASKVGLMAKKMC
jgi:hypothetical protein